MEGQLVSGTEEDALYHQMIDVSYHPESSVAIRSNCIGLGSVEHKFHCLIHLTSKRL